MKLTTRRKALIDSLGYEELLWWQASSIRAERQIISQDPWFQDETGDYMAQRIDELRKLNPDPDQ